MENLVPLVSIIVPVYNGEEDIKTTINELLNQSYDNIEIIIVDDGSTDQTINIVEKLNYDKRLRIIKQPHYGVSHARNTGLDNISGTFVSYVDSDDFISKDYVKILMQPFLLSDSDSIVMSVGKFKSVSKPQDSFTYGKRITNKSPNQALEQSLMQRDGTDVSVSARIYRVSSLKGLRFNDGIIFEDLDYNVRYLTGLNKKYVISFVDAIVFEYYQRVDSIMHRAFTEEEMSILRVIDDTILAVNDSNERVQKALKNKLISALAGVYARATIDNVSMDRRTMLYDYLLKLSKNFATNGPVKLKSALIVMSLKFGKRISTIILCNAYKITKKI